MDRINGAGHIAHMFVAEDAGLGRPPTEITAAWLNGVQEELVGVIEAAGIAPSESNLTQLKRALDTVYAPVGSVSFFARSAAPTGWLKANGATISRTVYASLFAAIGTTFGAGDGATTFKIPDLRGEFPRGWDDGRGIDVGRVFGSTQADALQSHEHLTPRTIEAGGQMDGYPGASVTPPPYTGDGYTTMGFRTGARVALETRPRNIALLACIRY